ncbi:MAG: choice-of-anchor L domain-containing protein [Myxococcales bacterium]|nr:choice-of-anchor L domain-containing protein [Myxococcales bacterium]MCB9714356.1 choice-of-anchor L domain-containing protein [Myxococcales bacterium]
MSERSGWSGMAGLVVLGLVACDPGGGRGDGQLTGINVTLGGGGEDTEGDGDEGNGSGDVTGGEGDDAPGGDDAGDGPKFDLGSTPEDTGEEPTCEELGNCECTIPEHVPCDAGTNDPFRAMGLNCPGELAVDASTSGPASAIGIRSAFGATNTFDAREGSVYAVIGSGLVGDLNSTTPAGDSNQWPTHCNDDLGPYDPGGSLPAPLVPANVGGDCTANPGLVGSGDCSNTIQGQFSQGVSANDYVEMRFDVQVPPDVVSFSYDFAFFSTEYPWYYGSQFNDMYVGWLESEKWTGNISFDGSGNPISLNAGFLDYRDDGGNLPQLAGTCMRQHAGTGWLTTTAGVTGGEMITVVFAVFDLSDSILDSYVFLDDFEWGCEPTGGPTTQPEG